MLPEVGPFKPGRGPSAGGRFYLLRRCILAQAGAAQTLLDVLELCGVCGRRAAARLRSRHQALHGRPGPKGDRLVERLPRGLGIAHQSVSARKPKLLVGTGEPMLARQLGQSAREPDDRFGIALEQKMTLADHRATDRIERRQRVKPDHRLE